MVQKYYIQCPPNKSFITHGKTNYNRLRSVFITSLSWLTDTQVAPFVINYSKNKSKVKINSASFFCNSQSKNSVCAIDKCCFIYKNLLLVKETDHRVEMNTELRELSYHYINNRKKYSESTYSCSSVAFSSATRSSYSSLANLSQSEGSGPSSSASCQKFNI